MSLLVDNPSTDEPPHIVNYPLWVDNVPHATCACHWWWELAEVVNVSTETELAS